MTEVLEETITGLPELPEGQWWRIGEISSVDEWGQTRYGTGGWASSSGGKMSAIQIMEKRWVTKSVKIPVYGDRWWNKNKVMEHEVKTKTELKEVSVFTRLFCGYATEDESKIPEHAYRNGGTSGGGQPEKHHYSYHENADGARALAEMMVKEYHIQVRRERACRIAEEAKTKAKNELFGDYPPKTLVSA